MLGGGRALRPRREAFAAAEAAAGAAARKLRPRKPPSLILSHDTGAEEAKEASTGREESKQMPADSVQKQFAGFLSHYKVECGTEARLVQRELRDILPPGRNALFLDSDDLNDLRLLLQHVKDTEVLVLLQSKGVLTVGQTPTPRRHRHTRPRTRADIHTRPRNHALMRAPRHPYAQRPWVILELYTAITNKVPVVALNVNNASAYDYGGSQGPA